MQAETYDIQRNIEDTHWWFKGRRDIINHAISRISLHENANILEIGCGTGGNLGMLARHGKVTGIEMNPAALEIAQKRNIAPILGGSLPNGLPTLDDSWDMVALFDVLEHIDDDLAALKTCRNLLSGNGYILITVPAFMFLWSQHDIENHHKRRYRVNNIRQLAHSAGLDTLFLSYFNFWLFPPTALVKLARNIKPYKQPWKDMEVPQASINTLLFKLLSSEKHIMPNMSLPFGTSIIAILSVRKLTNDNDLP